MCLEEKLISCSSNFGSILLECIISNISILSFSCFIFLAIPPLSLPAAQTLSCMQKSLQTLPPATILLEFGELPCHTAISATHGLLELQKPHSAILLLVLLTVDKILAARLQLRFSKMQ